MLNTQNSQPMIPYITGGVKFRSDLTLEEVGEILSRELFGGLPFGGKDESIHEEIPAIFIEPTILGLQIILDGYNEEDEDQTFLLSIRPLRMSDPHLKRCIIDKQLSSLIIYLLRDQSQIVVLE
jgi:hypothetical protein